MKLQSLYTKIIGKECRTADCEEFRHRKPRKSMAICVECSNPMTEIRRLSWSKILFFPFLLLLILIFSYVPRITFLNLPIENRGFIILLDTSGSMSSVFPQAREEAKKILEYHKKKWWIWWRYANIIYYNSEAYSVLGQISRLDEDVVKKLSQSLDASWSGGGTELHSAIQLAAQEVAAYGKPTTLLILTDGVDGSIADMLSRAHEIESLFRGVTVNIHSTTPRIILSRMPITSPADGYEQYLQQFSSRFHGEFGATSKAGGCGRFRLPL